MSLNGSAVILAVNTGTAEAPTFTVIPCQTSGDYSLSVAARDTSCKDSPDETNAPGSRSRTLSVESFPTQWPELVADPVGVEQKLRHAAETGLQVLGRIVVAGDAREEFTATITGYNLSAGREDTTTLSMDLQVSGAMTPVAAS